MHPYNPIGSRIEAFNSRTNPHIPIIPIGSSIEAFFITHKSSIHQFLHPVQVAFPSSTMPLQIFEARYRVLFSTLLAGEEGCVDACMPQSQESVRLQLDKLECWTSSGHVRSVSSTCTRSPS